MPSSSLMRGWCRIDSDAFKIRVANQLELRDTLTVIHHMPELQRYIDEIKRTGKDAFTSQTYSSISQVLSRLILFVMDAEESATVSAMSCRGTPHRGRQDLLREHGGVELLVDMLEAPFTETEMSLPDMFEAAGAGNISYANAESAQIGLDATTVANDLDRDKLRVVFGLNQLVYRLLMVLSQDHISNKKACSSYLEVFVGQLGFGLNSAGFLSSLVHDNIELLDTIPAESIEQSLELILSQGRKPRYLRLLTSLCTYKEAGVLRMQEMVCGTLFGLESENLPDPKLLMSPKAGTRRRQWKQSAVVVHQRCTTQDEPGCGLEVLVAKEMVSWHGPTVHEIQRFIGNMLKGLKLNKQKVQLKDHLFDCGLDTEGADFLLINLSTKFGIDLSQESIELYPSVQMLSLRIIDLLPAPLDSAAEVGYEWVSLRTLDSHAKHSDYKRYFIEYINLATSLCNGRNYVGILRVKDLFGQCFTTGRDGQEVVTAVVMDQELSDMMRGVFAKLLMSLYVDANPQTHLQVPRLTWVSKPSLCHRTTSLSHCLALTASLCLTLTLPRSLCLTLTLPRSHTASLTLSHSHTDVECGCRYGRSLLNWLQLPRYRSSCRSCRSSSEITFDDERSKYILKPKRTPFRMQCLG